MTEFAVKKQTTSKFHKNFHKVIRYFVFLFLRPRIGLLLEFLILLRLPPLLAGTLCIFIELL